MGNRTIDEHSLSQIRLTKSGRPIHIHFNAPNTSGEQIFLSEDGLLCFDYYEKDLKLVIHSDDSPAIFYSDGSLAWVRNGLYHRDNGNPAIIDTNHNTTQYWKDGSYLFTDSHNPNSALISSRAKFILELATSDDASLQQDGVSVSEKRDESNSDLLAVALVTLGTAGLLNCFMKKTQNNVRPKVVAAVKR